MKSALVNVWLKFEHTHGLTFSAGVDSVKISQDQIDDWTKQTGVKAYAFNQTIYGFVNESDAIMFSLKFN